MAKINILNAEIKTTSVEIKTIILNQKQMTLSLFKQIPKGHLINYETMTLNGLPWGHVNYFWKEEYDFLKIHILWQKEKELRRDILFLFIPLTEYNIQCYVDSIYKKLHLGLKQATYPHCYNHILKEELQSVEFYEQEIKKYEEKYNKLLDDLCDLPQLFIAV